MIAGRTARVRSRLVELFALDPRSLALFRIALAATLLADLAIRASDLAAHYTDSGIAPRGDVLAEFAFLHDRAISLHLAGGSALAQAALFAAAVLAALAMLVGYRTRGATIVCWVLTTSVQLRNLYVGAGYDALLRMLLLWGCFLPLGARASLDAAREGPADAAPPRISMGGIALLLQMAVVFFAAGYGKWVEPAWRQGTAIADILADDMRVTALGMAMRDHAGLLEAVTRAVPWVEMLAPLLFFSPLFLGPLRTTAVVVLAAMTAGFALCLHVGLFPWATAAGLAALLPAWFWERCRRIVRAAPLAPPAPAAAAPRRSLRGLLAEATCAVLLAFVLFWNLGPLVVPGQRMPVPLEWVGTTAFLQQAWTLFAKPATRTGWLVMPGRLRDGGAVDLLAAGGRLPDLEAAARPVRWERPPFPGAVYANDRWRNFLDRAVRGTDTSRRLNLYGRFLCREWNARHADGEQLVTFELWWIATDLEPGPRHGPEHRLPIWGHDCFS